MWLYVLGDIWLILLKIVILLSSLGDDFMSPQWLADVAQNIDPREAGWWDEARVGAFALRFHTSVTSKQESQFPFSDTQELRGREVMVFSS